MCFWTNSSLDYVLTFYPTCLQVFKIIRVLLIFFLFFEKANPKRAQSLEINSQRIHKIFKIQLFSTLKLYTKYEVMG